MANAHIAVFTSLYPEGDSFAYTMLTADESEGVVIQIEVFKNKYIWPDSAKDYYARRGAQNIKLERDALRRLEYNKGIVSFEDQQLPVGHEFIEDSDTLSVFMRNVVPNTTSEKWLTKQRLIIDGKLTVAGALIFSDEPQPLLPKAAVKIYRYETSDAPTRESLEGQPETIEGSAYAQISASVTRVVEIVERIPVMRDSGFEAIQYPNTAIHEIVTNAIIHRDYSSNDDTHIRIFNNRIEIYSPGKLPGHIKPSNILEERLARNQKIVRLLNKFPDPPNKDVGEGLNAAFDAMRALQLKEPEVSESESGVLVVLRHEKLASPEQKIVDFLQHHEEINNTQARSITFIGSENTVKRIFQKMMKAEIIERIPDRPQRNTAYRKGAKFTM
jgi:ATP-dependent DNA helicase RecG